MGLQEEYRSEDGILKSFCLMTIMNNLRVYPICHNKPIYVTCSLIPPPSAYTLTLLFSSQSYFLWLCSHILQFQEHKCEHDGTNKSTDRMRLAFPEWCTHNLSLKCGKSPASSGLVSTRDAECHILL